MPSLAPYAVVLLAVLTAVPRTAAQSLSKPPAEPLPPAAASSDAVAAERSIRWLESKVKENPDDFVACNKLAGLYLQRLRETGDVTYLGLAGRAARASLATLGPERNTGGLSAVALVEYAGHEFTAAREHARRLTELEPVKGYPFQILGDALLDLGEYDQAEQAYRQMEQVGGVHGLTRVAIEQRKARLAALHGDMVAAQRRLANALALTLALAVPPRETIAWTRWQLGETAFAVGQYAIAEQHHRDALDAFPGYFRALASLGRDQAAQQRYPEAIELYRKAMAVIPLPEYAAALGDLYTSVGRPDEARKQYELVEYIGYLNALNRVLYNRELAYFYADHDLKLRDALELAKKELELRKDIYAYDLLAWAQYKNGNLMDARTSMEQALKLGTQDAKLFFHAGMIHYRLGEPDKATAYLRRALKTNPAFHILQAHVAEQTLRELEKP